jgi:hypothetical protein
VYGVCVIIYAALTMYPNLLRTSLEDQLGFFIETIPSPLMIEIKQLKKSVSPIYIRVTETTI